MSKANDKVIEKLIDMTQKQKNAIKVLNKIKEQWWKEGHTNLSEEDYMTILEAIIDNNVTYIPQNPIPQPLEPYYQKEWTVTCKKD